MNGEKFDLIISDIHPGRSSSTGMDQNLGNIDQTIYNRQNIL